MREKRKGESKERGNKLKKKKYIAPARSYKLKRRRTKKTKKLKREMNNEELEREPDIASGKDSQ